jgi:hypothetical protein
MEFNRELKNVTNFKCPTIGEKIKRQQKKYFVLLAFAFITTLAYSQPNYQDVVYLKNGSIIRGVIIEQDPNVSIKIQTDERNVFVFFFYEIEKLTKEPYQVRYGSNNVRYKGVMEFGIQWGIGNLDMNRFKLNIINGIQVNPYFSFGLGTGIRWYQDTKTSLIPLYSNIIINLTNNKNSPFISLGTGYSFEARKSFNGVGYLFSPSAGVSFESGKVNMGITYELQCLDTGNLSAAGVFLGIFF